MRPHLAAGQLGTASRWQCEQHFQLRYCYGLKKKIEKKILNVMNLNQYFKKNV